MNELKHSKIFNISGRRNFHDSAGIYMNGELVYHNIRYWIDNHPEVLWKALYDRKHKLSITHEAYSILKKRMAQLFPNEVGKLLKRKYKYSLEKEIRGKLDDPSARIVDPNCE